MGQVDRAGADDGDGDGSWSDTVGHELTSCLKSLPDARERLDGDPLPRMVLDLLTA